MIAHHDAPDLLRRGANWVLVGLVLLAVPSITYYGLSVTWPLGALGLGFGTHAMASTIADPVTRRMWRGASIVSIGCAVAVTGALVGVARDPLSLLSGGLVMVALHLLVLGGCRFASVVGRGTNWRDSEWHRSLGFLAAVDVAAVGMAIAVVSGAGVEVVGALGSPSYVPRSGLSVGIGPQQLVATSPVITVVLVASMVLLVAFSVSLVVALRSSAPSPTGSQLLRSAAETADQFGDAAVPSGSPVPPAG